MRVRLRPAHTPATVASMYHRPWHGHTADHDLRLETTVAVCRWFQPTSVADLSCGDATVTTALAAPKTILGDIAPGYLLTGPIEETVGQIGHVDLFVCSETLEHLDDPDMVLRRIRGVCDHLVVSTPIGETDPALNMEHYWGWDLEGFGQMLAEAGFAKTVRTVVETPPEYCYDFQIWGCT